tara:strand:- start:9572 stop:10261 length:690 start_codon:yes stop_codon:yes gene_type:complete
MGTRLALICVCFKMFSFGLMKKSISILILTTILFSCKSDYRGRMVRVKKQKIEVNPLVKNDDVNQNSKMNLKLAVEDFKDSDERIQVTNTTVLRKTCNSIEGKEARKTKKPRNRYPLIPKVIRNQPQDSIQKDSIQELSEEEVFIRKQYKIANNLTWISLVSIFIFPPISFALSTLALNIYERYENPGVRDRYILAKTIKDVIKWLIFVILLFSVIALLIFLQWISSLF